MRASRSGQRAAISGAQLGERARTFLHEPLAQLQDRGDVDALEAPRPAPVAVQLAVEDRLDRRSEAGGVAGADEVDRAAHEDHADGLAALEVAGQDLRVEVPEAGAQREVRRGRVLRLEPEEVLDGVERGHRGAFQQQLAGEQRAVERAEGELGGRHWTSVAGRHARFCPRWAPRGRRDVEKARRSGPSRYDWAVCANGQWPTGWK